MDIDLNKIIMDAKAGDKIAEAALISSFRNLISSVASNYDDIPGFTMDDLKQEGVFCLIKSVKGFDESKGNFASYFATALHNRFKDIARHEDADRSKTINTAIPIDEIADDEENTTLAERLPSADNPEQTIQDFETIREFYDRLKGMLNDFQYKVMVLYLERLTYDDIANKLGVPVKKVDNAIYQAKNKYKSYLESALK